MAPKSSFKTLKIVFWIFALPLLAIGAWQLYISVITGNLQRRADDIVAGIPQLSGYPLRVHVERGAERMWVTGLLPDHETRRALLGRLKALAPTVSLTPEVSVLPKADVEARLNREGLRRALERARLRTATLVTDLSASVQRFVRVEDRRLAEDALKAARDAKTGIEAIDVDGAAEGRSFQELNQAIAGLRGAAERLNAVTDTPVEQRVAPPKDATEAADAVVHVADRLMILVSALEQRRNVAPLARSINDVREQAVAVDRRASEVERRANEKVEALDTRLEQRIAELERMLKTLQPKPPTPLEELKAFVGENAIFFENDLDYREPAVAAKTLDGLASLLKATDVLIRVVGYTDEVGATARNSTLSAARAKRVVDDLVARGIAPGRLVPVGRTNALNLSSDTGPGSSNRRVEFEIGYVSERRGGR
ncbi:MAG: OmpA family protein [Hyphomicrobiaceae bacterium]